ncbi:L-Aspartase-like protein [Crepidotus variabilis]|uniref:L-Aspartase-like protein n=1 Tax=Crepidotus variabilis TaxID=179855 RepID=A0A9P6EIC6_9AGAR|nr:L-Aspartase-like protein [Crepidotus variabilis]
MILPDAPTLNGFGHPDATSSLASTPPTETKSLPLSISSSPDSLLYQFVEAHAAMERYKHHPIKLDGHSLTTAAVVAAARHGAAVQLDDRSEIKDRVQKSRQVVVDKVNSGASIYGLSTGFGGSADTRTDKPIKLGDALVQHQHIGILPTSDTPSSVLPLQDPAHSTTMPESWVRGAMLIRMNSLIRGHSGVRWELIEKMKELMVADITPVVPLRGSISASGDLSPLSYIAGALVGNETIQCYSGSRDSNSRQKVPSHEALKTHGIEPIELGSKEHLGILNGTAFSAAVAALAIDDAMHLALLAQVCTAMGTEALNGTRGNYASFIHATARPHPGQVESAQNIWHLLKGSKLAHMHEEEVNLKEDQYSLRQDRYPLRTSPQFLGPQIEDIVAALTSITRECNSTTDNPLIETETGFIHHGGNFQAMAVTNSMEKTRLALHHIGKLLFSQSTELLNPTMNRGLPPSLAASDPSLNYHAKGVDIATAAYVAELGYLATPVSTHIQSAEMHNQAVNSMALVSARATITSLDVLSMLMASYLYLLCQALDLRTLHTELMNAFSVIIAEELSSGFSSFMSPPEQEAMHASLLQTMTFIFEKTTIMDSADQMQEIASSAIPIMIEFFKESEKTSSPTAAGPSLTNLWTFQNNFARRATEVHATLRREYLTGVRGPTPASAYMGLTKGVYEYVRKDLGVKMHGDENLAMFPNGLGKDNISIGQNISKIYEALRDGKLRSTVISLFLL